MEQFSLYESIGSSKSLRGQHLAQVRSHFAFPSSEETCFGCLRRRPQYRLPCGHWTCQTCIRIFYNPNQDDPWLYQVDVCILCGFVIEDVRIRVKPDTATVRVLSIDGGGTRGRAPLEFLRMLQHCIALPCSVQRHFDIVYGTSSGDPNSTLSERWFADGDRRNDCVCFVLQQLAHREMYSVLRNVLAIGI